MRISAYLVVAGLIALGVTPLRAQSLAEVAKKQEDQSKGEKSTARVYGNKDLKETPAPPPSSPGDAAKPADAATAQPVQADAAAPEVAAAAKTETKDQAYWSKRIKMAREQVDSDRVLADALQTRVNSLTTDIGSRDDPAQRAKLIADLDRVLVELDRVKKAVTADEKAIGAIEEEARRAGAPPGWLR